MTTQDTERRGTDRRETAGRETARRETAGRETARRETDRRETARRETARREAAREIGRLRVGSSVLREGRPDRMQTTTRDRDELRAPARGQARRGNGPFRADSGRADSGRADSSQPDPASPVPRQARARRRGGRPDLRAVADAPAPSRPVSGRPSLARLAQPRDAPARATQPAPTQPPVTQPRATPARETPPRKAQPRATPARRTRPRAAPPRSGSGRPTSGQETRSSRLRGAGRAGYAAGAATLPRMPFVLLVLALLGGGLICLLVVNTTLGGTSFRISQLQSTNATLATQEQALQQRIAAEKSPAEIAHLAYQLGMRVQANGNILDLGSHRFFKLPTQPGATIPLGAPDAAVTAQTGSATSSSNVSTAGASTGKARTGKAQTSNRRGTSHPSGSGR